MKMKEGVHPKYGPARFECACGNVIETQSTRQGTVKVEICSNCHPIFTGQQRLVDSAGRVEKFMRKFGDKAKGKKANPAKEAKKAK
jgi:large subunit ribosomal protein L31